MVERWTDNPKMVVRIHLLAPKALSSMAERLFYTQFTAVRFRQGLPVLWAGADKAADVGRVGPEATTRVISPTQPTKGM